MDSRVVAAPAILVMLICTALPRERSPYLPASFEYASLAPCLISFANPLHSRIYLFYTKSRRLTSMVLLHRPPLRLPFQPAFKYCRHSTYEEDNEHKQATTLETGKNQTITVPVRDVRVEMQKPIWAISFCTFIWCLERIR